MPVYKVRYKADADPDVRVWLLGAYPDRDIALGIFNSGHGQREGIGPFDFGETGRILSDYHLVKQGDPHGPEMMFALCKED